MSKYVHDHWCNANHVTTGEPCPGNPKDSDHGDRGGWTKTIEDAAKGLRNNGDKWEENARKSWRREDAANNRWLGASQELATVNQKLAEAEARLERVTAVIEEHEDCGDACMRGVLFDELRDALR